MRLEHARKPSHKSGLLSGALRTLESNPLLDQHLHPAGLLHHQDALVQLLPVGGPWRQSEAIAARPEGLANLGEPTVASNLIVDGAGLHDIDIGAPASKHLVHGVLLHLCPYLLVERIR